MISSSPLVFFPSGSMVPIERLARLLKDIILASELEEYRYEGLISEPETLRLFLEQREGQHVKSSRDKIQSNSFH